MENTTTSPNYNMPCWRKKYTVNPVFALKEANSSFDKGKESIACGLPAQNKDALRRKKRNGLERCYHFAIVTLTTLVRTERGNIKLVECYLLGERRVTLK